MATNIKTEDSVSLHNTRVSPVERSSPVRDSVQSLPQQGKELPPKGDDPGPDSASIEQAVDIMNEHVQLVHRQLQFSVDDDSGRIVITVIDSDTEEVIRQIPSEEALNVARRLIEGSSLEIFDHFA